jgi:hypothetical protein
MIISSSVSLHLRVPLALGWLLLEASGRPYANICWLKISGTLVIVRHVLYLCIVALSLHSILLIVVMLHGQKLSGARGIQDRSDLAELTNDSLEGISILWFLILRQEI